MIISRQFMVKFFDVRSRLHELVCRCGRTWVGGSKVAMSRDRAVLLAAVFG